MTVINGNEYTNRQAHKVLWDWLANNPEKGNEDFFKANECSAIPINYCYACEDAKRDCSRCLIWTTQEYCDAPCYHTDSILTQYRKTTGIDRQALAKEIANMKWN